MSGGRGGFVPVSSSPHASPRNMIDAISEIQQYHIIERTGQDIPSDFLTMRTYLLGGGRSLFSWWGQEAVSGRGRFLRCCFPLPGECGKRSFRLSAGLRIFSESAWFFFSVSG